MRVREREREREKERVTKKTPHVHKHAGAAIIGGLFDPLQWWEAHLWGCVYVLDFALDTTFFSFLFFKEEKIWWGA